MRSFLVFLRVALSPLRVFAILVSVWLWMPIFVGIRYGIDRDGLLAALGASTGAQSDALPALWWSMALSAGMAGMWMRATIARRVSGERAWLVPGLRTKQLALAQCVGVISAVAVFLVVRGWGTPLALAFASMSLLIFVSMFAFPSTAGATQPAKLVAAAIFLTAFVFPSTSLALVQYATVPAAISFALSVVVVLAIVFDREMERFMTLTRVESDLLPDIGDDNESADASGKSSSSSPLPKSLPGDLLRPLGALGAAQRTWHASFRASWVLAWRNGEGQVMSAKAAMWIIGLTLAALIWVRRWGSLDLIVFMVIQMNVFAWVPFEHQGMSPLPRDIRMRVARDAALIRMWTFTIVAVLMICAVRAIVPGPQFNKFEGHIDVTTPLTMGLTCAAIAPALQSLRQPIADLLMRIFVIDRPPPIATRYMAGIILGGLGMGLGGELQQFFAEIPLWQSLPLFALALVVSHMVFHMALRLYYDRRDLATVGS